jgi:hypothetical protein
MQKGRNETCRSFLPYVRKGEGGYQLSLQKQSRPAKALLSANFVASELSDFSSTILTYDASNRDAVSHRTWCVKSGKEQPAVTLLADFQCSGK